MVADSESFQFGNNWKELEIKNRECSRIPYLLNNNLLTYKPKTYTYNTNLLPLTSVSTSL
nr:MAG TPA: hypothetical protein [Caudoviricetes sp.]